MHHFYGRNAENRLFEIIDYVEFLKKIEDINEKLKPDYMLPNKKNDDSFLTISINLPVISKINNEISELIPIPMWENNKLYILDMKTTEYYVRDIKVHLLLNDTLKSLCRRLSTHCRMDNFISQEEKATSIMWTQRHTGVVKKKIQKLFSALL